MSYANQVVVLLICWLSFLALAQNNQYTTSVGSNGEYIWQSTSDFIPSEPGQAYGTIPVGDEMTMEFDWTWHGRARAGTGDWELFFRVGFDPSISGGCDGHGSRYPSFWLPGTSDEMHVSVSSGIACQAGQRFDNFGTISAGTEYHVHIHFDPTTVTLRASQTSDWPDTNVTQTYPRNPTPPESVGQNASVWWISPGWSTTVNYAGAATFRNVVLTSVIYSATGTPAPTSAAPTTTSPATPAPTTASPTTPSPTTAAPTTATPTTPAPSSTAPTTTAPTSSDGTSAPTTTTTGTQLTVFTDKPSATPSPTEAEGQVSDETTSTPRSTLGDGNLGDGDTQEDDGDTLMYIIIVCGVVGCCICCGLLVFCRRRKKPRPQSSETPGYTEKEFAYRFPDGQQHGQILDDEPDTDDQVMTNLNTHQQMHMHQHHQQAQRPSQQYSQQHSQQQQHMNYAPMHGHNGYSGAYNGYHAANDEPPPPPPMQPPARPSQPSGIQIVTHPEFGAMHGGNSDQKQARGGEMGSPYTPRTPDGEINPDQHQYLSEAQRQQASVTLGGPQEYNGRVSIASIDDIPNDAQPEPQSQSPQLPAPPQRNVNDVVNALQYESQRSKTPKFLSLRHQQPQQQQQQQQQAPLEPAAAESFGYQQAAMTDDEDDLIVGDMITHGYIGGDDKPPQQPPPHQQQQQGIRPLPPAPAQPNTDVHITYGDDDDEEEESDDADNAIEQKLTIGAMDDEDDDGGLRKKQAHQYGALQTNDQEDDEDEDDIYAPAEATDQ